MNVIAGIGMFFLLVLLLIVLGAIAAGVANIVVRLAFAFDDWLDDKFERRKRKCR